MVLRARFCRRRVADPKKFDKRSLRTVTPPGRSDVRIIVGCPKNHFKHGRCQVGLRTQTELKKKVNGSCPVGFRKS